MSEVLKDSNGDGGKLGGGGAGGSWDEEKKPKPK